MLFKGYYQVIPVKNFQNFAFKFFKTTEIWLWNKTIGTSGQQDLPELQTEQSVINPFLGYINIFYRSFKSQMLCLFPVKPEVIEKFLLCFF